MRTPQLMLVMMVSGFFAEVVLAQGAASDFPSRPVTVINTTAPGGPIDQEFRIYSPRLTALLGQNVVMDFKVSAEGAVAGPYVARSNPDGHTLLILPGGLATAGALNPNLPYDLIRDFSGVSLINRRDQALVANPNFPAKTLQEYFAYARANPGKINMSNSGTGGTAHLATSWMHSLANVRVTYIPYKGAAPQIVDLIAGRVDVSVAAVLGFLPHIKSGKLRPLAGMGKTRSKMLPEVPSVAEQGLPGYDYSNWMGVSAPKGTPQAVINKLNEAIVRMVKMPEVAGPMGARGIVMVGSTPAEFDNHVASEVARWHKVVKDNNIKIQR